MPQAPMQTAGHINKVNQREQACSDKNKKIHRILGIISYFLVELSDKAKVHQGHLLT